MNTALLEDQKESAGDDEPLCDKFLQLVDTLIRALVRCLRELFSSALEFIEGVGQATGDEIKRATTQATLRTSPKAREGPARDPFRSPYCYRALILPQRALETLKPYGTLSLTAVRAEDLLAMNALVKSDPYIEVYLNDELKGRSEHVDVSLNPTWKPQFKQELEIFSPMSVVRVAIRNWNFMAKDDLMGFVEFYVGELDLDGKTIEGWFELRRPERFEGRTIKRISTHRNKRDDKTKRSVLRRDMVDIDYIPAEEPPATCGCYGSAQSSKAGVKKASMRQKPNAGQIYLKLKFTAAAEYERMAFCLPHPHLSLRPRKEERLTGKLALLELLAEIMVFKTQLEKILRPVYCIIEYVISWRSWEISLSCLLWCYILCFLPFVFFPSIPMSFGIWLRLIRWGDGSLGRRILAHGATTSLDDEGFHLVAGLGSTPHMMQWLERVIQVQGGQIVDSGEFESYASLIFRDREPKFKEKLNQDCFDQLLEALKKCKWITYVNGIAPQMNDPAQQISGVQNDSFRHDSLYNEELAGDDIDLGWFSTENQSKKEQFKEKLKFGRSVRTFTWLNPLFMAKICEDLQHCLDAFQVIFPPSDLIEWGIAVSPNPLTEEQKKNGERRALEAYKTCALSVIGIVILRHLLMEHGTWRHFFIVSITLFLTSKTRVAISISQYIGAWKRQRNFARIREKQWSSKTDPRWAFFKPADSTV